MESSFSKRIGPSKTLTVYGNECDGCHYHNWALYKHSRLGPNEYTNYCQHPGAVADNAVLRRPPRDDHQGRFIYRGAGSCQTPVWCPVLEDGE